MSFKDAVLSDVKGFVAKYFVTEAGKPLLLSDYQTKFLEMVLKREHTKYILLSSTRVGKTEVCACLALLSAIIYDQEEVVIVAPWYKQAERMFKRVKNYIESNPQLYALVDKTRAFRRDRIVLKNRSVLSCLSAANPEGLLGFGATTLIVDEAGSLPDEVFRTRILRMIAASAALKRPPVLVLVGTPHSKNFFYRSWLDDDFVKMRVTWEEGVKAGILDKAEVDYAKKVMTEDEFKMWYCAEWTTGETGLFDSRMVDSCMVLSGMNKPEEGWDYYAGLDVARLGTDENVFAVIRARKDVPYHDATVEFVYYGYRGQRPLSDIIGWANNLLERWNPRMLVVDELGMGAGVLDVLKQKFGSKVVGIRMCGKERVDAYLSVAEKLKSGQLLLPKGDEKLKLQFQNFQVTFTTDGKMKIIKNAKGQDDIVDALTFALYGFRKEKEESFYVADFMLKREGVLGL